MSTIQIMTTDSGDNYAMTFNANGDKVTSCTSLDGWTPEEVAEISASASDWTPDAGEDVDWANDKLAQNPTYFRPYTGGLY